MDRSGDAAARPHCRNSSLFCRPFGLGLIASIGIHGWGTEYTVGWESTWLSDKPSAVLTFINLFYGMIPVNSDLFNQLTPQVIESMNFGSGHGQNAAPWLLQLLHYFLGCCGASNPLRALCFSKDPIYRESLPG